MPRSVETVKDVAELKKKKGRQDAVVRMAVNGRIYRYESTSTAADDSTTVMNVIKPTEVGTGAGAWLNESRATRYFNKSAELNTQVKVLNDSYIPTSNPFVINYSHIGFTQAPVNPSVEVMEAERQNNDYAQAKVTACTANSMTVQITRPNGSAVNIGSVLNVKVGASGTTNNSLANITLLVRVEGI